MPGKPMTKGDLWVVIVFLATGFVLLAAADVKDVRAARSRAADIVASVTVNNSAANHALYLTARSLDCGDYALAEMIAKVAAEKGIPPNLLAAIVSVESSCNPLAISSKGAVGLAQIHVASWQKSYDFGTVNLFSSEQNLRVGAEILRDLIKKTGSVRGAVMGYNNQDVGYTEKVLKIAGIK